MAARAYRAWLDEYRYCAAHIVGIEVPADRSAEMEDRFKEAKEGFAKAQSSLWQRLDSLEETLEKRSAHEVSK